MPTTDEIMRRLLAGEAVDLTILSNAQLRVVGLAVADEEGGARALVGALKREKRAATLDATGHTFSVGYEAAGATVSLVLPPPFNLLVIGGAVLSGGYKLWDGRPKYARLLGSWRAHRHGRKVLRRLTEAAAKIEAEMMARVSTGRWP